MKYVRDGGSAAGLFLALAALALVPGCGGQPKKPPQKAPVIPQKAGDAEPLWKVTSARRQTSYARMDLPVVVRGMHVDIGEAKGPGRWLGGGITLFSSRIRRTSVEGPMVDQLTGMPRTASDGGSYLVPLGMDNNGGGASFLVDEPMPLYMKVQVSGVQEPGVYRFPVMLSSAGRASSESSIEVDVSPLALPTEPRVLAAVTTTTTELAKLYPDTFGTINGTMLDRSSPEDAAAMGQLDGLVKAAQRNGVALFVEDLGPRVKLDNVGAVIVDWDAYDRVMQPYMDGTAFADHVPLAVWLAPVPPRRLRDSPIQLSQYVAACADHFTAKGWAATPAFMHPALVRAAQSEDESTNQEKLRAEIARVLKLHMTREMLAVTNPDVNVPQARLWVVDDTDPRLPPAGSLATEESVRLWPWVCAARGGAAGVKGFVWRNGVASSDNAAERRALLLVDSDKGKPDGAAAGKGQRAIVPSLRLAWLTAGLNDTAMVGLLEKRSDPALVNEVLGGIVGRTGLTVSTPAGGEMPTAPAGFLYAGWPVDRDTWAALPGMLEKLVLANEPGQRVTVAPDDPLFIAAKLWLAKAHRPVARVAGYRFGLRSGEDGPVIDAGVSLLVENPLDAAVAMEARFAQLPGDFDVVPMVGGKTQREVAMQPYALQRLLVPVAGHVDALLQGPRVSTLQLSEKTGGSVLRLPVQLPIYRMKKTASPPKIDGKDSDWEMDAQTRSYGAMPVATHDLSRPDLLTGAVRRDENPATVRWSFDDDNLYVLIRCPQSTVSDERNTDWPDGEHGGGRGEPSHRWWGTDGVQVQLASLKTLGDAGVGRVVTIAFKPGGVAMTRTAQVKGATLSHWTDGPEGVKYGISIEKSDGNVKGYLIEAAIPRKWFPEADPVRGITGPALRVNVLRHRAIDLTNMSWSGPMVNDDDVSMMGLLLGNE